MSVAAIVSGIVAVAKAVPYIYELLDQLNDEWTKYKISQIRMGRTSERDKRDVILHQMSIAESNFERKILSTVHADYVYGRVSVDIGETDS